MGAGISIEIDAADLARADQLLERLVAFRPDDLMTAIGALGHRQTERRIRDEKTAPDGSPWPPNRAGTPTLVRTGDHLLASLSWTASGDAAEWGSDWQYAHVHQDGMIIRPRYGEALKFWLVTGGFTEFVMAKQVAIPARPFAGISSDNLAEMRELVTDVFGALLQ